MSHDRLAEAIEQLRRAFSVAAILEAGERIRRELDAFMARMREDEERRVADERRMRKRRTWPRPTERKHAQPLRPVAWPASLRAFS